MKKIMKTIGKKMKYMSAFICLFLMMGSSAFAAEPIFISGTKKLVNDLTKYLMGIVAIVTVLYLIITGYQWYMATEEEKPKFKKKAFWTIVVGVGILIASGVVSWVFGYYGG